LKVRDVSIDEALSSFEHSTDVLEVHPFPDGSLDVPLMDSWYYRSSLNATGDSFVLELIEVNVISAYVRLG
jgi:hypothetical protein